MKAGTITIQLTGPDDNIQFGLRLYKSGQMIWEYPLVELHMGWLVGYWINMATAQGADADKLGVRLGDSEFPLNIQIEGADGSPGFSRQLSPSAALQEFTYDLPPTSPSEPPPGQPPSGSPVLLGGLSLDKTQVTPGDKLTVGVQIHVNTTFRGQINVWLGIKGAPVPGAGISTGMRDFLSGSYSVPLELVVSQSVPPGKYPVTVRVNDQYNNALTEFTTDPILEVLAAPPPTPPPTGVVINSLTASPDRVKPGQKVTATAQVTVSGGFKGMMSFAVAGVTESTDIKDWLAGNYPVSLDITVPQNAQAGMYQGIWLVVDTVVNKQLAAKEVSVEVLPASSTLPPPTPSPPTSSSLAPVIGVLALAMVGSMVTGLPRMLAGRK